MPAEERERAGVVRGAERCDLHPMRPAVARCERCGRPLCLACAIPVRGAVLGVGCLPEPLAGEVPASTHRPRSSPLVGIGLGVCLLATALPWSRFGPGSGAFGAWNGSTRWALLAATVTAAGSLLWLLDRLLGRTRLSTDAALAGLGGLIALAAAMAIWRPPAFTRPWLGPWVALAGGLCCLVASAAAGRRRRRMASQRG